MKIYTEKSLKNFEFRSGAKDTAKYLTDKDFEKIEAILEVDYPNGIDDGKLNDIFWFDDDFIAKILGYSDWEKLEEDRDEKGV